MGRPGSHYGAEPGGEGGPYTPGYPQPPDQAFPAYPPTYPQGNGGYPGGYPQPVHMPLPPPVEKRKRRKWPIFVALILVGLVFLGAAGWRIYATKTRFTPTALPSAEPTPGPVLSSYAGSTLPNADTLRTQLDPLVTGSDLGKHVNVSVVDLATGQVLYERSPGETAIPAPNMTPNCLRVTKPRASKSCLSFSNES